MPIARADITGLVLCGGRGTRMGGVDKGLQLHHGRPLAQHALERLRPQVGTLLLNANRNLATYQALGVPVVPDTLADFPGPLAGWLAGLDRCSTPFLASVPCDTPGFPADLVPRLAQALHASGADLVRATTPGEDGHARPQPVFCLMRSTLAPSLAAFLHDGQRKVGQWMQRHRCVDVGFDDAQAFFNVNTLDELASLQGGPPGNCAAIRP
jgi:molybdopterin-guanine dinucleotide biosynthesis protein A